MEKWLASCLGALLAIAAIGCGPSGVTWDCTCTGDCDSNSVDYDTEVCSDGEEDDAPGKAIEACREDLGCSSWDIHCDCSATYMECAL